LILAVHGLERPDDTVSNDFYRQALDLDLRGKREHSTSILAAMGGISRVHFSRYKALLRLSDEALELADRHNLDEGQLRYVLNISAENQIEVVRQIVHFNLTCKQVKELCEQHGDEQDDAPVQVPKRAVQLVKLMRASDPPKAHELAQILMKQEKDIHLARARVQGLRQLLDDTEQYLNRQ
jgi:hypothetical protein